MSEKPESDEFDDEEADEPVVEDEDVDLDQVIKDLDLAKRRGQQAGRSRRGGGSSGCVEEKRTAELTSDFEDYDIGDERRGAPSQSENAASQPDAAQ